MKRHCNYPHHGIESHNMTFQTFRVFHNRFAEAVSLWKRPFCVLITSPIRTEGQFLTNLIPPHPLMKPDNEFEYLPLRKHGEQPPKPRGFLSRLLHCLMRERITYIGSPTKSSSGEEVEEDVIKF